MKRFVLLSVFLLTIVFSYHRVKNFVEQKSFYEKDIRNKSSKIMCPIFQKDTIFGIIPIERVGFSQGTGVNIDYDLVLTEHHVIEGAKEIYVLQDGSTNFIKAEVLFDSKSKDLTILELDGWVNDIAEFRGGAGLGEKIKAVGNAGAKDFEIQEGQISGMSLVVFSTSTKRFAYQLDEEKIRPGFSGGGLFDSEGRVVGMVEALGVEEAALAIPSSEIQKFLEENLNESNLRKSK